MEVRGQSNWSWFCLSLYWFWVVGPGGRHLCPPNCPFVMRSLRQQQWNWMLASSLTVRACSFTWQIAAFWFRKLCLQHIVLSMPHPCRKSTFHKAFLSLMYNELVLLCQQFRNSSLGQWCAFLVSSFQFCSGSSKNSWSRTSTLWFPPLSAVYGLKRLYKNPMVKI